MIYQPYSKLIAIKQWADRGLYDVASQNFDRLTSENASIMLRILEFRPATAWREKREKRQP